MANQHESHPKHALCNSLILYSPYHQNSTITGHDSWHPELHCTHRSWATVAHIMLRWFALIWRGEQFIFFKLFDTLIDLRNLLCRFPAESRSLLDPASFSAFFSHDLSPTIVLPRSKLHRKLFGKNALQASSSFLIIEPFEACLAWVEKRQTPLHQF